MAVFRLGSVGPEVTQIQKQLQAAGLYTGELDGVYGGGTEAAVVGFQTKSGLEADGAVGAATWAKLFASEMPVPALAAAPVAERALALTGSFETGTAAPDCFSSLAGNFDGQGMSFGALQFNFGAGTLQPILQSLLADHADVMAAVFHANLPALAAALAGGRAATLAFAKSIEDPLKHTVQEPWRGMFRALGRTPECQAAQTASAADFEATARDLAAKYGLWSERGYALMFDVAVQNGSVKPAAKTTIQADLAALAAGLSADDREVAAMQSVANRVAESAKARYVEDVRQRKLCIANGAGTVHGIAYDLAEQFGLRLVATA